MEINAQSDSTIDESSILIARRGLRRQIMRTNTDRQCGQEKSELAETLHSDTGTPICNDSIALKVANVVTTMLSNGIGEFSPACAAARNALISSR